MVKYSKCGKELGAGNTGPVASISAIVMGDEYIHSFYFCDSCDVYTEQTWRDVFTTGEDQITVSGPLSRAEGEAKIAVIRRCKEPWNERCRCDAHQEFFGPWR
jgi:hypothetical protein